ncbi:sterol desaturase family protein [Magnetococcales bacterium HHB-1]
MQYLLWSAYLYWGGMITFALIEYLFPCRPLQQRRIKRWPINFTLTISNGIVYRLIYQAPILWLLSQTAEEEFGLLWLIPMSEMMHIIIALLLLDFMIWGWHRVNHTFSLFWRFHRVHHTDLDTDVTTAARFHLGEILISGVVRLVVVSLLGIPFIAYLIFEWSLNMMNQFQHSNINLPETLDRYWRWILISPALHRIHHAVEPHRHNSNYGTIFSFWDRLFHTLHVEPQVETMQLGLDRYDENQLTLSSVLRMPLDPPEQRQIH